MSGDTVSTASDNSLNGNEELAVKEAYNKALKRTKDWDENTELYYLISVDDTTKGSKGSNGRRRKWNMGFAVPNENKHLSITISDNKFTNISEEKDEISDSMEVCKNSLKTL